MSSSGRIIAIGDIHGCAVALRTLLDAINPGADDTIITLGDHIDRGPDTRGVIDSLLELSKNSELISMRGNHEAMLLGGITDMDSRQRWLKAGGVKMLQSYGWSPEAPVRTLQDWFPESHWRFISDCRLYHETADNLFLHAGYIPQIPMADQPELALCWKVTDPGTAMPHCSGKRAFVGHTPQHSGLILDLGFLVCIDTNAARGGWLTAMDVRSGQQWQANETGVLRIPN